MILRHTAQRETKLLSILRQELALSSSLVKRLKYLQVYRVNGQVCRTNAPVRPGDQVTVLLEEPLPVDYPAEPGELEILYEDEALIALDKPPGMLVHPSSARNSGTLANRLIAYYAQSGQSGAVHPVSRLDRDTFGVVLLAKHSHIHALMSAQSKAGRIEKIYRAAVFGGPPQPEGILEAPILRPDPVSMLRCVDPAGRPARSAWRLLEQRQDRALLELRPLTGRTHQLRLHCRHLGCPILGDPQYHSPQSLALSRALGLSYQQLCAVRLGFFHPLEEKFVEIHTKQPLSLDFSAPGEL